MGETGQGPELGNAPDASRPVARDPSKGRVWLVRVVTWAALLLAGATAGYLVFPPVGAAPNITTVSPDQIQDPTTSQVAPMPSLDGLSEDAARLALRDAGLADPTVTTSRQPTAGPPGLVLKQTPAAGTGLGDGKNVKVHLTLSKPVATPSVQSEKYSDARSRLEQLGAVVRVNQVIRPGSTIGTVLSTVPAAGSTMPTVVTLNVADAGVGLAFDEMSERSSNDCYSNTDMRVAGKGVPQGVECDFYKRSSHPSITYRLTGGPLGMSFSAGPADQSGVGAGVLRVLGDGKVLAEIPLTSDSAPTPTRVLNLTGVRTLRFEAVPTDAHPSSGRQVELVLANPVVLGSTDAIGKLSKIQ
jgi:hypothetical protein